MGTKWIKYYNDDKWYCKINQQVTSSVCHYESLDTETLILQPSISILLTDIRLWQQMFGTMSMYFLPPLSITKRFYINFIYFVSNFKDSISRIPLQHDSMFWLIWSQFPHQSSNLWQYPHIHTKLLTLVTYSCETPQTFPPKVKTKYHHSLTAHFWKFKNEPQKYMKIIYCHSFMNFMLNDRSNFVHVSHCINVWEFQFSLEKN